MLGFFPLYFQVNNVLNINKLGAAKRPNINKNQGSERFRGRVVCCGELPGNYLCMVLSYSESIYNSMCHWVFREDPLGSIQRPSRIVFLTPSLHDHRHL